jgi:hypothetical protein
MRMRMRTANQSFKSVTAPSHAGTSNHLMIAFFFLRHLLRGLIDLDDLLEPRVHVALS